MGVYLRALFDKNISLNHNFLANAFLVLFLMDRFILSSGEFLKIGEIKFRMFFNLLAFLLIVVLVIKTFRVDRQAFYLISIYSVSLLIDIAIALMHSVDFADIGEDIRPAIFFFSLLYFTFFIDTKEQVRKVEKVVKFSAALIAIVYLVILAMVIIFKLPNFLATIIPQGEFMGRGGGIFFISSLIYVCVGFLFYFHRSGFWNRFMALFLFATVFLTFTRGFIIVLMLIVVFLHSHYQEKKLL